MTGSDRGQAAIWFGRLMRIAVPFGIASLTWNVLQIYELVTAGESPRPGTVVTILLNTGVAVLLIWQGLDYRRRTRR
jgi:hypothetical protein